jgi:hypothetical protein
MITIVARWDTEQIPNEYEYNLWRQIKAAFAETPADVQFCFTPTSNDPALTGLSCQQYDTMDSCLTNVTGKKVFIEGGGTNTISEIPTTGDIVLIFGNTPSDNLAYITDDDLHVSINQPNTGSFMYGTNAASVIVANWYGQP